MERKTLYFASGTNRPAEIRGFAGIRHPIGVAAPELSEEAIRELEALSGEGIPVFVDSGAFSEVEFSAAGPVVVRPITHEDWLSRLGLYRRLARALGSALHVVAPDMVGNQAITLERLTRYRREIAELAELGAVVLVPIQKGDLNQAEFHAQVSRVLAEVAWTPALPCKKAATTPAEIVAFCGSVKPARVHLLGLGNTNVHSARVIAGIEAVSPKTLVQQDSCAIRANVGWSNGRGGGPRLLTIAQTIVARAGFSAADTKTIAIGLVFGGDPESVWACQADAMTIRRGARIAA